MWFPIIFCGLIFQFKIIEVTNSECGTVAVAIPQIFRGTGIVRGQWPFLVALFHTKDNGFFCGGTIITTKHILTGTIEIILVSVHRSCCLKIKFQLPIVS